MSSQWSFLTVSSVSPCGSTADGSGARLPPHANVAVRITTMAVVADLRSIVSPVSAAARYALGGWQGGRRLSRGRRSADYETRRHRAKLSCALERCCGLVALARRLVSLGS